MPDNTKETSNTSNIRKIIYFDKETIRNILQEYNHGEFVKKTDISSSTEEQGNIKGEGDLRVNLGVPFVSRVAFLISGKLNIAYIEKKENQTTISSTEISEFEKLKTMLTQMKGVRLFDVENSSTAFRTAGGYLQFIKGGIEGIDIKEFKAVMEGYDGYDIYKIKDDQYVRFNNSAFVSNYKRNDLLATILTLYCIPVGLFERECFDFTKAIKKMEKTFSGVNNSQTLADFYSAKNEKFEMPKHDTEVKNENKQVALFDVVYACINAEEKNDG